MQTLLRIGYWLWFGSKPVKSLSFSPSTSESFRLIICTISYLLVLMGNFQCFFKYKYFFICFNRSYKRYQNGVVVLKQLYPDPSYSTSTQSLLEIAITSFFSHWLGCLGVSTVDRLILIAFLRANLLDLVHVL